MKDSPEADSRSVGRPLKFDTVEALDAAIKLYFEKQDPHIEKFMVEVGRNNKGEPMHEPQNVLTQQRPYTMAGLARAIGVDRRTLLNYKNRDEYFPSVQAAIDRCHEYAETQLFGPYANGAKFSLSNNFSSQDAAWTEKSAVDHTSQGEKLNPYGELSVEQLRALADGKQAPADDPGADQA